jgi:hypothetical protein
MRFATHGMVFLPDEWLPRLANRESVWTTPGAIRFVSFLAYGSELPQAALSD